MKKLYYWVLPFWAVFVTSCSDGVSTITVLTTDAAGFPVSRIHLGANKDVRGSIIIKSSGVWEAVAASADGDGCDWLSISPAKGNAGRFTVTLKALTSNMAGKERMVTLTLYGGGKALRTIAVIQAGMSFIEMETGNCEVPEEERQVRH